MIHKLSSKEHRQIRTALWGLILTGIVCTLINNSIPMFTFAAMCFATSTYMGYKDKKSQTFRIITRVRDSFPYPRNNNTNKSNPQENSSFYSPIEKQSEESQDYSKGHNAIQNIPTSHNNSPLRRILPRRTHICQPKQRRTY